MSITSLDDSRADSATAKNDTNIRRAVVRIKVFGIGGAGNNVLKRLSENNFAETDLIAVNTESEVLNFVGNAKVKCLQIGANLTHGKGTGGKVELGERAAKEDKERIKNMISGADMIFIAAGMGGGTGTGAAPIIAKVAKEMGTLTVGVVTVPFAFEGKLKQRKALEGVVNMQAYMDALIVVKNDNLMMLQENRNLTLVEAFRAADSVLIQAIKSPLIERSLAGARGIILNITGDENLTLYDVNEAAEFIFNQTNDDVNLIFGVVTDNSLKGTVQATVIATNFADSLAMKSPTIDIPRASTTISRGFNLDMANFANRKMNRNPDSIPTFQPFDSRRNDR